MINCNFIISVLTLFSLFGFIYCKSTGDSLGEKSDKFNSTDILFKSPKSAGTNLKSEPETRTYLKAISLLVDKINIRSIPFYDSTNFDNTMENELLTEGIIISLGLKKIYPYKLETVNEIWLREKVALSSKFTTLIFGFYASEQELFTTLVTFDSKFSIIDFKHIAYDEIAESCSRIESLIGKNKITVIKFDFCDNQTIDTSYFQIDDEGTISAVH